MQKKKNKINYTNQEWVSLTLTKFDYNLSFKILTTNIYNIYPRLCASEREREREKEREGKRESEWERERDIYI